MEPLTVVDDGNQTTGRGAGEGTRPGAAGFRRPGPA